MNEYKEENIKTLEIPEKEQELAEEIYARYKAAYEAKEDQMHMWKLCNNYWEGKIRNSEDADDPNSSTNIILPVIESQVADLIDGTMDMTIEGGASEAPYIEEHKQELKWVWKKNKILTKLDEGERERLKLGTGVWRVYYDFDKELPIIEPVSPEFVFPDPKISHPNKISEGDFFIYVRPTTRKQLRRLFGEKAKMVQPEAYGRPYDPRLWGLQENNNEIVNDQTLLFEYWEMYENDEYELSLRRIYMAGGVILEDSHEEDEEPFYSYNKYPFVFIPCYKKQSSVWGLSDTELLMDAQDTINDLDDQIKMNAALTGNVQHLIGKKSGIDPDTWTNTPGLRIKAIDINETRPVTPPSIPMYILQRRQEAFQESEIISGRSDITEGRKPGSIRAASAIMALQEAGSRRAKHKKLMLECGFSEIMTIVDYLMREFMTEKQSFDMEQPLWTNPSRLEEIPEKVYNEDFNPLDEHTEFYTDREEPVYDEEGLPVEEELRTGEKMPVTEIKTKRAEFDIVFQFGAGLPNTPSFLYQAAVELMTSGVITQEEARRVIKDMVNWPITDPEVPEGQFVSQTMNAETMAQVNNQGMPVPEAPPQEGGMPPEGAQGAPGVEEAIAMLTQAIEILPPEILQQILGGTGGQVPGGMV